MPRKVEPEGLLSERVEIGVSAGMKAAIGEVATRMSEEEGAPVVEARAVRRILTAGLHALGVRIRPLPGRPHRPPRGKGRKPDAAATKRRG